MHHFTEGVGAKACVTINWQGTADALLEQAPPAVHRFFNPPPWDVIDELCAKIQDFKKAFFIDGLDESEYENFGPVVLFRDSFIKSWAKVRGVIAEKAPGR